MTEQAKEIAEPAFIEGTAVALKDSLGWDTQRVWATAVQVFLNPGHGLIVFKESIQVQAIATTDEAAEEPPLPFQTAISRNVVSIVMPREVLVEFRDVLLKLLPLDADSK